MNFLIHQTKAIKIFNNEIMHFENAENFNLPFLWKFILEESETENCEINKK